MESVQDESRKHSNQIPEICVVGVLVAFDVERDPLDGLVDLLSCLYHLIIVDNAVNGHPLLTKLTGTAQISIIRNANVDALAGAYNAAIAYVERNLTDATHILFIDDDTETRTVDAFLTSVDTRMAAARADVAAVAPASIEKETGLRAANVQLKRFTYKVLPRDISEPTEVSFLINSMSLWNLSAIRRIGGYNTRLRVDRVDTDYCLRAAALGLKLILNPGITFVHSIGKRKKYHLLGWTLQSGGHSAERRRMIACNTLLLAKHNILQFPSFLIFGVLMLVYEALGIVVVEDDKLRKLGGISRGLLEGLIGRY